VWDRGPKVLRPVCITVLKLKLPHCTQIVCDNIVNLLISYLSALLVVYLFAFQ